ncbi:MAG: hypothetical protein DMD71_00875 [Gemmatimonadetes bacterium]|nr:MAG: hypothetical protein DMD74_04130 [Gemmatimonadota bacterium]PYO70783.1 MAG: hypothetical protein DMD71_00875 [Gemmatimonadota bacterium]
MLSALLQIQHDSTRMESVYFWSAVLIAITPIVVFGGVAVWLLRKYWRERRAGTRNAEVGTRNETPG